MYFIKDKVMDFKKIDKKKYKYRPYDLLTDDEKEKFGERKHKTKNSIGYTSTIYSLFPYCDELESLRGTHYNDIIPFGKFTADFLLQEHEKGSNKGLYDLLSEHFSYDENFGLTENQIDYIVRVFSIQRAAKKPFPDLGESGFFSFFLMNEYLQQNEIDTYGDFIEQKGNEIYDNNYLNFDLTFGKDTRKLFDLFVTIYQDFTVFSVAKRSTKKDIELFKTISKDTVVKILDEIKYNNGYFNGFISTSFVSRQETLRSILSNFNQSEEEKEEPINYKDLERDVVSLYIHFLNNSSRKPTSNDVKYIIDYISELSTVVTQRYDAVDRKTMFINDVDKIFKKIDKLKDELNFEDFAAVFYAVYNSKSIIKNGNASLVKELFFKELDNDEGFVDLVKFFTELFFYYEKELPTEKQWREIIDQSNDLGFSQPPAILLPLMVKNYNDKIRTFPVMIKGFKDFILNK